MDLADISFIVILNLHGCRLHYKNILCVGTAGILQDASPL